MKTEATNNHVLLLIQVGFTENVGEKLEFTEADLRLIQVVVVVVVVVVVILFFF